jgi:ATP-dependent RNA helicase DDX19/DBP5
VQVAKQETQALCMCPTRELVVQNLEVLRKMGTFTGITSCSTADEDGGQARRTPVREQVGVPGCVR